MDSNQWHQLLKGWEALKSQINDGTHELPCRILMRNSIQRIGGELREISIEKQKVFLIIRRDENGALGRYEAIVLSPENCFSFINGKDANGKVIFVTLTGEDCIGGCCPELPDYEPPTRGGDEE